MRPDIAPGRTFPDYEPPDHTAKPRRLSATRTVQGARAYQASRS